MIAIIDYQMGETCEACKRGFEKVGYEATITSDPEVLRKADKTGASGGLVRFRDAIAELRLALQTRKNSA